jgi:hypothetical protein
MVGAAHTRIGSIYRQSRRRASAVPIVTRGDGFDTWTGAGSRRKAPCARPRVCAFNRSRSRMPTAPEWGGDGEKAFNRVSFESTIVTRAEGGFLLGPALRTRGGHALSRGWIGMRAPTNKVERGRGRQPRRGRGTFRRGRRRAVKSAPARESRRKGDRSQAVS